jgi:hypothetical protein
VFIIALLGSLAGLLVAWGMGSFVLAGSMFPRLQLAGDV